MKREIANIQQDSWTTCQSSGCNFQLACEAPFSNGTVNPMMPMLFTLCIMSDSVTHLRSDFGERSVNTEQEEWVIFYWCCFSFYSINGVAEVCAGYRWALRAMEVHAKTARWMCFCFIYSSVCVFGVRFTLKQFSLRNFLKTSSAKRHLVSVCVFQVDCLFTTF